MPRRQEDSYGAQFAQRFTDARRELARAPRLGARDLPTVIGLLPGGSAIVPIENLYAEATEVLVDSHKVYLHGDNVALEAGSGDTLNLQPLTSYYGPVPCAASLIANYFTCQTGAGDNATTFFPPPQNFVACLLARGPTRDALPLITTYARRPAYDLSFVLCGHGYHAQQRILVHGLDVEPILLGDAGSGRPIRDRLPHPISVSSSAAFAFERTRTLQTP